jgi:hypothetical protein
MQQPRVNAIVRPDTRQPCCGRVPAVPLTSFWTAGFRIRSGRVSSLLSLSRPDASLLPCQPVQSPRSARGFATRTPPRARTLAKSRKLRATFGTPACRQSRKHPCKTTIFRRWAPWIAPRRSGVRVPLAPSQKVHSCAVSCADPRRRAQVRERLASILAQSFGPILG